MTAVGSMGQNPSLECPRVSASWCLQLNFRDLPKPSAWAQSSALHSSRGESPHVQPRKQARAGVDSPSHIGSSCLDGTLEGSPHDQSCTFISILLSWLLSLGSPAQAWIVQPTGLSTITLPPLICFQTCCDTQAMSVGDTKRLAASKAGATPN